MTRRPAIASIFVSTLALAACSQKPAGTAPGAAADLIITGGPILTMEVDQPTSVEAIVVDDGKIVFVGSKVDALKQQADGTVLKDLAGRTLMPGFIDGHAHAQQFGMQAVGANLLAPPDGSINTIDDVVSVSASRRVWMMEAALVKALSRPHTTPTVAATVAAPPGP